MRKNVPRCRKILGFLTRSSPSKPTLFAVHGASSRSTGLPTSRGWAHLANEPFFFGATLFLWCWLLHTSTDCGWLLHTSTQTGTVVVVRVLCRGVGVDLENDYAFDAQSRYYAHSQKCRALKNAPTGPACVLPFECYEQAVQQIVGDARPPLTGEPVNACLAPSPILVPPAEKPISGSRLVRVETRLIAV